MFLVRSLRVVFFPDHLTLTGTVSVSWVPKLFCILDYSITEIHTQNMKSINCQIQSILLNSLPLNNIKYCLSPN